MLALLEEQRAQAIAALRDTAGDPAALAWKCELDLAIARLQWCAQHAIDGRAVATALPWPADAFGSFAVVECNDEGEPVADRLLQRAGEPVVLLPGDLLVHRPRALPDDADNG
ncbi:hypothetical protein [Stenotrophomonas rhizophila]|uniref:hypothetical protein n=1 Tax=Stenotrophomonas rhizophila TaxID=216778 RepID=UPI000456F280|nr:hypothetical protein [Stenotrophomonas rhizophila]AHY60191.1 hypothetical protein DX03_16255 [Stenotrophomonas rhizophila]